MIMGAGATLLAGTAGLMNAMPGGGNFGFSASADTSGGGTTNVINPAAAGGGSSGGDTTGGSTAYVDYNPGKSDYSTVGGIP
jgi:hypothetical protein